MVDGFAHNIDTRVSCDNQFYSQRNFGFVFVTDYLTKVYKSHNKSDLLWMDRWMDEWDISVE